MAGRLFSVEEADALLPRIRALLGQLPARPDAALAAAATAIASNGSAARAASLAKLRTATAEVLAALQQLGVIVRDLAAGLIDFPSERDGEPIFLCWRAGEESVSHWHDDTSGFSGRQPL